MDGLTYVFSNILVLTFNAMYRNFNFVFILPMEKNWTKNTLAKLQKISLLH